MLKVNLVSLVAVGRTKLPHLIVARCRIPKDTLLSVYLCFLKLISTAIPFPVGLVLLTKKTPKKQKVTRRHLDPANLLHYVDIYPFIFDSSQWNPQHAKSIPRESGGHEPSPNHPLSAFAPELLPQRPLKAIPRFPVRPVFAFNKKNPKEHQKLTRRRRTGSSYERTTEFTTRA